MYLLKANTVFLLVLRAILRRLDGYLEKATPVLLLVHCFKVLVDNGHG